MSQEEMDGIILAGGMASRLLPAAAVVSKQLLPVYDKPMVYYPLTTLMLAGIRRVLIISTPLATPQFRMLFGDGSQLGMEIHYKVQDVPRGLADAFIVGKEFIGGRRVALILGDNIIDGYDLGRRLKDAAQFESGATVFSYEVEDPERYGVVEVDKSGIALSIEEKPITPKSKLAVIGLYLYDNQVISIAENVKPSARQEIEITSVNVEYLIRKQLRVSQLDSQGDFWFDAGTFDSLLEVAQHVAASQKRRGLLIGSPEAVAFRNGWIDAGHLLELAGRYQNDYGRLLRKVIEK